MIRIDKITGGRFGNRVLQYNTLMQLSSIANTDASCVEWEGNDIFSNLVNTKECVSEKKSLIWSDLLGGFSLSSGKDYCVCPNSIHNVFWEVTKVDPRKFIRINDKYKRKLPEDKTNVGIHLRGDDILGRDGNNGREIHSPEYYRKSIDIVENEFDNTTYYVCTDDRSFDSYIKTVEYLNDCGLNFELGCSDHFRDFSTLTECDVLIASSSTFVVCAGFLGKKDKKIIHSLDWIEKNLNHIPWHFVKEPENIRNWQLSYDNFWVELYNGGNEYYNAWRFV